MPTSHTDIFLPNISNRLDHLNDTPLERKIFSFLKRSMLARTFLGREIQNIFVFGVEIVGGVKTYT